MDGIACTLAHPYKLAAEGLRFGFGNNSYYGLLGADCEERHGLQRQDSATRVLVHPLHMINEYLWNSCGSQWGWHCFRLNPSLQAIELRFSDLGKN